MDIGINCYSLLGYKTCRKVEYDFAYSHIPKNKCNVLDIGSTGSLFPFYLAKKGHNVHSVDSRLYHEKHHNLKIITGDLNNVSLEENYYDVITCISTIEHIGLSAYGDPAYNDGDQQAIDLFKKLLKDEGKLILTTPFCGKYQIEKWIDSSERIYDHDKLMDLFNGFKILNQEYYIPKSHRNWIKSSENEAELQYDSYPRSNLSCFCLELRRN